MLLPRGDVVVVRRHPDLVVMWDNVLVASCVSFESCSSVHVLFVLHVTLCLCEFFFMFLGQFVGMSVRFSS